MNETDPIVAVSGLRRVFDVSAPLLSRLIAREPRRTLTAVDGADFTILRGETFGLVGESGSGKSTLARMVVGLLEANEGRVTIEGVDLARTGDKAARRAIRRRIQMIFQDPYASLNPRWRVGDIIAEPIRAFGAREAAPAQESGRPSPGSASCSSSSAFIPPTRASFRTNSPAASASGSRSRARSPPIPISSSATSRPPPSTCRFRLRSSI